jgi:hypothetical protein
LIVGADFIEKATPSFKKSWDRARVELATPDLFTKTPACAARTAVADIIAGQCLHVGEQVTVEIEAGGLVARRGNTEVARFTAPPAELMRAVESSCGIAKGTVEQVHDLADVAEISLC